MFKEEYLQQLLKAVYDKGTLNLYDYSATIFGIQSEEFTNTKCWADQLVRDKLAAYADAEHTQLQATNFGKFWILKGGYEMFLKEGQCTKEKQKEKPMSTEKEKLVMARLKLTNYRLTGFWLALVISSIGFLLSLFNLYLLMEGWK